MNGTYSLGDNNKNYYDIIDKFSDIINMKLKERYITIIDNYNKYIKEHNVENLRSSDEYIIEFLGIGILWTEYIRFALELNFGNRVYFKCLSFLRENNSCTKEKLDKIKGYRVRKLVDKQYKYNIYSSKNNFIKLLEWLKSTGDFKEEVLRLENWLRYFNNLNNAEVKIIIDKCIESAKWFCSYSDEALCEFTRGLDVYIKENYKNYIKREDLVYCTKNSIQYYYNLVCSEILNKVYKKSFKDTKNKIIFVPSCMRPIGHKCKSSRTNIGFKCSKCCNNCNVNKIETIASKEGYMVSVIPHESDLFRLEVEPNTGIIGIACAVNLLSGGWKALRLGYIPQCVVLKESGCEHHWIGLSKMTNFDYGRLKYIMQINN